MNAKDFELFKENDLELMKTFKEANLLILETKGQTFSRIQVSELREEAVSEITRIKEPYRQIVVEGLTAVKRLHKYLYDVTSLKRGITVLDGESDLRISAGSRLYNNQLFIRNRKTDECNIFKGDPSDVKKVEKAAGFIGRMSDWGAIINSSVFYNVFIIERYSLEDYLPDNIKEDLKKQQKIVQDCDLILQNGLYEEISKPFIKRDVIEGGLEKLFEEADILLELTK